MSRGLGDVYKRQLRDMLQKIIVELDELSGHMEVCDAVIAANEAKRRGEK